MTDETWPDLYPDLHIDNIEDEHEAYNHRESPAPASSSVLSQIQSGKHVQSQVTKFSKTRLNEDRPYRELPWSARADRVKDLRAVNAIAQMPFEQYADVRKGALKKVAQQSAISGETLSDPFMNRQLNATPNKPSDDHRSYPSKTAPKQ